MSSKSFINITWFEVISFVFLSMILTIAACGPKPTIPTVIPEAKPTESHFIPAITDLTATSVNGQTTIYWKSDRQNGQAFGGYDIYIAPNDFNSRGTLQPRNPSRYPGDTDADPSAESFKIIGLDSGKIYKAWVIGYSSDAKSRSASDTVVFCPMLSGEITLSLLYSDDDSGFDFAAMRSVPARSPENDIMFFAGKGLPKLSGPDRLDAKLSATRFMDLGSEVKFNSVKNYSIESFSGAQSLPLRKGDVYLMRTADGHFGKVEYIDVIGKGGRQRIRLKFMYNPAKQYHKFQ